MKSTKSFLDLAKKGKTVIVVSSEMTELRLVTDRIAVMSNGRLAGVERPNHSPKKKFFA